MRLAGTQEPASGAGEEGGQQRGVAMVSEGARALIRRCLSVEQRLRPTAAELLADPWLSLKETGTGGGGALGAGALPSPSSVAAARDPQAAAAAGAVILGC